MSEMRGDVMQQVGRPARDIFFGATTEELLRVVPEGLTAQYWEAESVHEVRPTMLTLLAPVMPEPQPISMDYSASCPEFETEQVDLQLHYRPANGRIPELWVLLGYSPRAKTLFFAHRERQGER
jgi:hypothetical protein